MNDPFDTLRAFDTLMAAREALRKWVGVCLANEWDALDAKEVEAAHYWDERGKRAAAALAALSKLLER